MTRTAGRFVRIDDLPLFRDGGLQGGCRDETAVLRRVMAMEIEPHVEHVCHDVHMSWLDAY